MTAEGDRLTVIASGADDDLEDVLAYGRAIIATAVAHGTIDVLCDERALDYRLGTLDTHRAAATVAEHAPRVARVAIVCQERYARDAEFFETVATNRGLMLQAFTDITAAEHWLGRN